MPSVAVVTRTKDRPLLLRRAVRSVLQQTRADLHMVIVNDGGAPGPVDQVVEEHAAAAAGRISVRHHPSSVGMEAASNAGIAATDSEYVCIHDDDDSWHPRFLERTVAAMEDSGDAGAVTDATVVVERVEGDVVRVLHTLAFNGPPPDDGTEPGTDPLADDYDPHLIVRRRARRLAAVPDDPSDLFALYGSNLFPPIAFAYRRRALDTVGPYDESLKVLGDWDFNLRFLQHHDVTRIARPYAYYHHRYGVEGPMGNTINLGHDDVRLRLLNRYLRQDLAAGALGPGYLANLGHAQRAARDHVRAWYDDEAESLRHLQVQMETLFTSVHKGLQHVDGRVLGVLHRLDNLEALASAPPPPAAPGAAARARRAASRLRGSVRQGDR